MDFRAKEVSEMKQPVSNGYQEIKPEGNMSAKDAGEFWNDTFHTESNINPGADKTGNETKSYYDDHGEKYREGNQLEPNKVFEKNGYRYETDDKGRVCSAEGKLQLRDHVGRNEITDSRDVVAKGKMADTDDRGHLIADRFNGIGELENLVPMDGSLNKGDYKRLENTLEAALKDGADVRFKVEPVYEGESNRPSEFRVSYSIDGDKEVVVFKNRSEQ